MTKYSTELCTAIIALIAIGEPINDIYCVNATAYRVITDRLGQEDLDLVSQYWTKRWILHGPSGVKVVKTPDLASEPWYCQTNKGYDNILRCCILEVLNKKRISKKVKHLLEQSPLMLLDNIEAFSRLLVHLYKFNLEHHVFKRILYNIFHIVLSRYDCIVKSEKSKASGVTPDIVVACKDYTVAFEIKSPSVHDTTASASHPSPLQQVVSIYNILTRIYKDRPVAVVLTFTDGSPPAIIQSPYWTNIPPPQGIENANIQVLADCLTERLPTIARQIDEPQPKKPTLYWLLHALALRTIATMHHLNILMQKRAC